MNYNEKLTELYEEEDIDYLIHEYMVDTTPEEYSSDFYTDVFIYDLSEKESKKVLEYIGCNKEPPTPYKDELDYLYKNSGIDNIDNIIKRYVIDMVGPIEPTKEFDEYIQTFNAIEYIKGISEEDAKKSIGYIHMLIGVEREDQDLRDEEYLQEIGEEF